MLRPLRSITCAGTVIRLVLTRTTSLSSTSASAGEAGCGLCTGVLAGAELVELLRIGGAGGGPSCGAAVATVGPFEPFKTGAASCDLASCAKIKTKTRTKRLRVTFFIGRGSQTLLSASNNSA